jgi:diguanylate cyclase (GGDEF)-like protein
MRESTVRRQRAWLLYLLAGILATGGYFLLPSATAQNVFVVLVDLSVLAAIVAGILIHRPKPSLPWCLFALGMAAIATADTVWAAYEESPYPSMAEVLYLSCIPFFILGLLLICRGGMGRNGANLIDPLIIATGAGMLMWVLLLDPAAYAPTLSLLERLLAVTYLFVYVLMIAIVVCPLLVPAKRSPALYLLCSSLVMLFVGDLAFGSVASGTFEAYDSGSLYYAWALLACALFGSSALHPSMIRLSEPVSEGQAKLTAWRLVLLTGATLTAPLVLVIQAALAQPIAVVLIVGGSVVLFLLVALRMAGMIGERQLLERRLRFQAFHDPLTRLPNRALFMDRLEQALARTERQSSTTTKVAVLFVDLDDFKEVNDSLGHQAGDRVLVAVAHRLRGCLRPTDTAARIGGDEFVVLLEQVEDAQVAVGLAERILRELREPVALEGLEMVVGVSIGIALGGGAQEVRRPGDLLRKADLALYRAKSRGKDSYEVFVPGLENKIEL